MNKKLLILILVGSSGLLWAMQSDTKILNNIFLKMVNLGTYEELQYLINQGADVNATDRKDQSALAQAVVSERTPNIIRLLIEHGAQIEAEQGKNKPTALHYAVFSGSLENVQALLYTIPLAEQKMIQEEYDGLVAGAIAVLRGKPQPNKDIRKLIAKLYTQPLIDRLVAEQMVKIEHLMRLRTKDGEIARDLALTHANLGPRMVPMSQGFGIYEVNKSPEYRAIATLLDPNNLASREAIKKEVERNIRHILFEPRKNQVNEAAANESELYGLIPMDTGD